MPGHSWHHPAAPCHGALQGWHSQGRARHKPAVGPVSSQRSCTARPLQFSPSRCLRSSWSSFPALGTSVGVSVVPGSPHVPVGKGHLHAEHRQHLGAVVPLPGQQPALTQGGGQALPGARAAPALTIPLAGLAAPWCRSVPGQPSRPADGDGDERGGRCPPGHLQLFAAAPASMREPAWGRTHC